MGVRELTARSNSVVSLFGSSRPQPGDPEYALAKATGFLLARAGFVVCNGGYGGIMEASARGAKEAGGKTLGIICSAFPGREANGWIDEVIIEESLINRLMKLMTLGDAYVILKGGTGTLLELAAVWEFMNKRLMQEKPIVLVGDFWAGVVGTLKEEMEWEGLEDATRYVTIVPSAESCVTVVQQKLETAS
jgi:uncharacterized protein (TIGR00730 family)